MTLSRSRLWLLFPLIVAALLATTGRAEAGPILSSATECNDETLEQPFVRWGDSAKYFLVPNGTFSRGADGWQGSAAQVIAENQPYSSHAAERLASLRIPVGTSVTSPAVCIGIEHPTMRFFARGDGSLLDVLTVEVLFEDASGNVHSLPIGVVGGADEWRPSAQMPLLVNFLALLPGERTAVAFRFTARGAHGAFAIDDVYVDPYYKG